MLALGDGRAYALEAGLRLAARTLLVVELRARLRELCLERGARAVRFGERLVDGGDLAAQRFDLGLNLERMAAVGVALPAPRAAR